MIRAFVAVPLPEDLQWALEALSFQLPLPRRLPSETLHLTLAFLGEHPEPVVEDVHYALEAIRAPRFTLSPRGVGHFGGTKPRAVYAGVLPEPALDLLQGRVVSAVRQAGVALDARKFVPHITLGRIHPREVEPARLELALVENAGFAAPPFEVDRFVLYRSYLGHGGAAFEELARYPLE